MKKNDKNNPAISIVVPFYNEEENVDELYQRLTRVMTGLRRPYELIFIDDGSTDRTHDHLVKIFKKDRRVQIVRMKKNFGQTAGLQAGFDYAAGEVIISMDGDLQHDPAEIPLFLDKMAEGYDIVSGWRKKRVDNPLLRKFPSWVANRMMRFLSGVKIHDFGTTYKAYRRSALKNLRMYGELHRFIPALISRQGVKIAEIPIKNIVRLRGKSKYGLSRVRRVFFDLLTVKFMVSFVDRPLQLFGLIGFILGGIGFTIAAVLTVGFYFFGWQMRDNLGNLLLSIFLMVVGIQLIMTGLLAEVISRVYFATHRIKIYNAEELLFHRPLPEKDPD